MAAVLQGCVFLSFGLPFTPFTSNRRANSCRLEQARSYQGCTYHSDWVLTARQHARSESAPTETRGWVFAPLHQPVTGCGLLLESGQRMYQSSSFSSGQFQRRSARVSSQQLPVLSWAAQHSILYNTLKLQEHSYCHHPH